MARAVEERKDDGDDAAGAATTWAMEDGCAEGPAEQFRPGDGPAGPSGWSRRLGRGRSVVGGGRRRRRRRDDGGAESGVGGEDAEVLDEVGPGG